MKLSADWLTSPDTKAVMDALQARAQAYFVGGCVRNTLLDVPVADIDIATPLVPEQIIACADAAGLRSIPTGIAHGTITVISNGAPFEVTTFRRDVETDGRRAVVAYSEHLEEDAQRRDFTMNGLYAASDGTVLDPVGGMGDLRARRVRFIGDASARIAEDGLRIVRFFRFHALYGDLSEGLDEGALAAIADGLDHLDHVSRERVGDEVRKLLVAPDPAPAVAALAATGVLARLLPGADPVALAPLVHLELRFGLAPAWPRRLAALGASDPAACLRLSRAEATRQVGITAAKAEAVPLERLAYLYGPDIATDATLIREATLAQAPSDDWRDKIETGAAAEFPVSSKDLLAVYGEGPALGAALKRLEDTWIDSGFSLTKDALLQTDAATRGG